MTRFRIFCCCGQRKIDRLAGYRRRPPSSLEDEVRRLNGRNPLQMDFQQAGIANIKVWSVGLTYTMVSFAALS